MEDKLDRLLAMESKMDRLLAMESKIDRMMEVNLKLYERVEIADSKFDPILKRIDFLESLAGVTMNTKSELVEKDNDNSVINREDDKSTIDAEQSELDIDIKNYDSIKTPKVIRKDRFSAEEIAQAEEEQQLFANEIMANDKSNKNGRRTSMLLEEVGNIKKTIIPYNKNFIRLPPDVSNLYLKELAPEKVLGFLQGVLKTVQESRYEISVQSLISPEIKNIILAKFCLTSNQFYNLEYEQIVKYISNLLKPETVEEFVHIMATSLKSYHIYDRFKFEKYYLLVLKHVQDYKLLFQMLAEDNSKNIPPVNDKHYGLIKLFGMHLHKEFFRKTRMRMSKETYTTIYDFLNEFSEVVLEYYKSYKLYLTIPDERDFTKLNPMRDYSKHTSNTFANHNSYNNDNGNNYVNSNAKYNGVNINRRTSPSNYRRPAGDYSSDKNNFNSGDKVLMNSHILAEDQGSDDSDNYEVDQKMLFNIPSSDDSEDDMLYMSQPLSTQTSSGNTTSSHDNKSVSFELNATTNSDQRQLCTSLILFGKCKLQHDDELHRNKYLHDMKAVEAKRRELSNAWKDIPMSRNDNKPPDPLIKLLKR
jgi:hypothetical protein